MIHVFGIINSIRRQWRPIQSISTIPFCMRDLVDTEINNAEARYGLDTT